MQNDYWNNEYYRNYVPFYFYCPYCQSNLEDYERFNEEKIDYGFKDDYFVSYPIFGGDNFRAKSDIEKIAKGIYEEISKDLKFVESLPITKELMHFMIKVISEYVDKNHAKYIDPIEMKIEGLMKALKKDLYWVFEILGLFGVTPIAAISFVENVISMFLREIMPAKSKEENSPMWGM